MYILYTSVPLIYFIPRFYNVKYILKCLKQDLAQTENGRVHRRLVIGFRVAGHSGGAQSAAEYQECPSPDAQAHCTGRSKSMRGSPNGDSEGSERTAINSHQMYPGTVTEY